MTPAPIDFLRIQRGRTRDDLVAYYGVGKSIIQRWFRETGCPRGRDTRRGLPAGGQKQAIIDALRSHGDAMTGVELANAVGSVGGKAAIRVQIFHIREAGRHQIATTRAGYLYLGEAA